MPILLNYAHPLNFYENQLIFVKYSLNVFENEFEKPFLDEEMEWFCYKLSVFKLKSGCD